MDAPRWSLTRILLVATAAVSALLVAAAFVWRSDILRYWLDPKVPFQTYKPPAAPDYAKRGAWALLPDDPSRVSPGDGPADVFFVHPTTYDGGRHWNAPIRESRSRRTLEHVMLPNYAGPFARVGRVFAPRYRQANLYSGMTLREDARDARRFAYRDVEAAFRFWRDHYDLGRPLVIVGVEQGGTLVDRLVHEEVATSPGLKARLAGVYLIATVVPADRYGPGTPTPACGSRSEVDCVVAYRVLDGEPAMAAQSLSRSLVWNEAGELAAMGAKPALCVNPLLGARTDQVASMKLNLGAANATGVEWGTRPAFLSRQVGARCQNGMLRVTRPKSPSLQPSGAWADRQKVPGYNLFYADLEADAEARVKRLVELRPELKNPAPPIRTSIAVKPAPVHRIS
jgi:hypothetical protein